MPIAARFPRRPREVAALLTVIAAMAVASRAGGVPGVLALALAIGATGTLRLPAPFRSGAAPDPVTGLASHGGLVAALDRGLAEGARSGRATALLLLEIEGLREIEGRYGRVEVDDLLRAAADRLDRALRNDDAPARLDGATFAVALAPARALDLAGALQVAGRLQHALSDPLPLGDGSLRLAVSVGLALSGRLRTPTAEGLLRGATLALLEARRSGPGSLRSYSEALRHRVESRSDLAGEVAEALERGDIQAHFQPQLSTRTGAVTGFEALARWHHSSRGLLPPSEFLPAVEEAGLMPRLGEAMLSAALGALKAWEREGIVVPSVGVNFSHAELCEPRLVERIGWELDRHELAPDRLVVEVLENVVASRGDDAVVRNLAGLARLGCCLDLDDFGTGQASLGAIRRFAIERIKIDRSFVARLDQDAEQARMVGAILTMAERLGLDTIAEGVETEGERQMLTRLGCGHVQGFGIARPMPFSDTVPWMRAMAAGGAIPPPVRLRAV